MQAFQQLTAVAAPLLRDNIDTDAIIPSREIKAVSRTGLADGLFAAWRYRVAHKDNQSRELNPEFVLNQPAYANTKILLGGENFGCGSSREHAVWALHEYGIRVIIAPSFAPIFFSNCIGNSLLPARMPLHELQRIAAFMQADPQHKQLTVDLQTKSISINQVGLGTFAIDDDARATLLAGLDAIDQTLQSTAEINAFQNRDQQLRPWVYL